jgi:hypothetical protein
MMEHIMNIFCRKALCVWPEWKRWNGSGRFQRNKILPGTERSYLFTHSDMRAARLGA